MVQGQLIVALIATESCHPWDRGVGADGKFSLLLPLVFGETVLPLAPLFFTLLANNAALALIGQWENFPLTNYPAIIAGRITTRVIILPRKQQLYYHRCFSP